LLNGVTYINNVKLGNESIHYKSLKRLRNLYNSWMFSVLGLEPSGKADMVTGGLIEMILQLRADAKLKSDFETADRIREELTNLGITVKDRKDGADWEIN